MLAHEIPSYPWQAIASDLFTWDDKDYVLFVDYYSRYFEVFKLNNTHRVLPLYLSVRKLLHDMVYQKSLCRTMVHNIQVVSLLILQMSGIFNM
jgi:hypothetical protein